MSYQPRHQMHRDDGYANSREPLYDAKRKLEFTYKLIYSTQLLISEFKRTI